MKKNKILKIVASVFLTLSILAAGMCSILIAMFGSRGLDLSRKSAQEIYDDYLKEIVVDKESSVYQYYMTYIQSLETSDMKHEIMSYQNEFAEANSNYFFRITPEDSDKYPGLASYYTEDYQYHATSYNEHEQYKDDYELTCTIPLSSIVQEWKDVSLDVFGVYGKTNYDTDLYDGYNDDSYYSPYDYNGDSYYSDYEEADESTDYAGHYYQEHGKAVYAPREIEERYGSWNAIDWGDVWINYDTEDIDSAINQGGVYLILDGTNFRYNLVKDDAFQKEYNNMLKELDSNNIDCYEMNYDSETGTLTAVFQQTETVAYQIDSYVKSEFTAHDEFYNSLILRYSKPIAKMLPYVFAVSVLLILVLTIYLASAAGHRAGEDVITCNAFDRIPYDLFLVVYVVLVYAWYTNMFWYSYSKNNMLCISILFGGVCAALFPPALMTTATRLKADGWGMFKNTIIWRVLMLLKRLAVFIWKKLVQFFAFLGRHFNLYWKWLGAFLALEVLKVGVTYCADPSVGMLTIFLADMFIVYMLLRTIGHLYTLKKGAEIIAKGDTAYTIDTKNMPHELKQHGENLNSIRDGIRLAVEERMKSERMKTELITNVSHDIKTPLTSIVSYVDLISKEEGLSETQQEYVDVLQRQSARLKKLIEDLIEASKASTGNLEVHLEKMNVEVLIGQVLGEYENKLNTHGLQVIVTNHVQNDKKEDTICVMADGRHLWRVIDNLMGNIVKYAQENSRVYIDIEAAMQKNMLQVAFKNISHDALNISGDELMERFVRGDRSRNTEGSGLGLSIAKNLMELQDGKVEIMIDGDLFKVVLLLKAGS